MFLICVALQICLCCKCFRADIADMSMITVKMSLQLIISSEFFVTGFASEDVAILKVFGKCLNILTFHGTHWALNGMHRYHVFI